MKKLSLIGLGILTGLAILEISIRGLAPQPPAAKSGLNRGAFTVKGSYPHQTDLFSVTVHVNTDGFVDSEWKTKKKKRTLLIGDSFVQGAQVELHEGVGRQLGQRLPEHEILSIGVPGAGTTTALELAKIYGPKLEADTIILGFLLSNDVFNNHHALDSKPDKPYRVLKDGQLTSLSKPTSIVPPLLTSSHLIRFLLRSHQKQNARSQQFENQQYPRMYDLYKPNLDPIWTEAWDITEHLLHELADWSNENGIQFGIVLFPSYHELSTDSWTSHTKQWPDIKDFSTKEAHTKAYQLCKDIAPTLDIFEDFRAAPNLFYYPADGHWTPKGHALAAEAITPFIIDIYKPTMGMIE